MKKTLAFNPLWLAGIAFALAGLAQSVFNGLFKVKFPLPYIWLLYLVAAAFFLMGFGNVKTSQFASGRSLMLPETSVRFSRLQLVSLVLAVLLAGTSFFLFGRPKWVSDAWMLHLISLLLFIAAFIPFSKIHIPSLKVSSATHLVQIVAVLGVLMVAVFARLWQLSTFPFGDWADEATHGLAAAQILSDPTYRPTFVDTMPSHFNYLIALAFSIFGVSPFALRLVTAAFGVAGVVFAYLLFRRWFGMTIGIVAAGMLAVMRYDLTFSRFGVHGISVPAFELAAIFFLDRALAEKRLRDFAWLGITLGWGLSFYTAFRLFPLALGLFVICVLIGVIRRYGRNVAFKKYMGGLLPQAVLTLLALILTLVPVIQFASQNPSEFFARTSTVSIFTNRDEPNLSKALWNNTRKHLEMFNVAGDRNGRHNLPGAPMLDPIMGVLFVLGMAVAIWRWRDLPNLLMLLVFVIMLQNGILSLDFEAPQSLRSIGVIPALVYFIVLPLAAVIQTVDAQRNAGMKPIGADQMPAPSSPVRHRNYWQLAFIPLLAIVAYINFDTFFNKYKNDPSSWAQSSTAETIVANTLKQNADRYDFVVSAMYDNHPTVRFLAGDIKNVQRWTAADHFPLVRDSNRGIILLFDETLLPAYHDIRRVYPNAKFIEHHAPTGTATVLYEAVLSPEDLQSISGVTASYFAGTTVQGKAVKSETLPQINLHWNKSQPVSKPFVAELRSILVAPDYGSYRFTLKGAPGTALWLDENPVTDSPMTLARGTHTLRLQVPGDTQTLELWWQPPDSTEAQPIPAVNLFRPSVMNSGLSGAYYPTPDWSGDPAFLQIDPQVAFYFHIIPLQRPYSVKWTGMLFAPSTGTYTFALKSRDGSTLEIDNQQIVTNPDEHEQTENTVSLTEGWHAITIRFMDKTGGTRIYLYWTRPGSGESVLVPPNYLSPPMGQYPDPNHDAANQSQ